MGIMIFMLKSQRRAFRWPNNFRARLYMQYVHCTLHIQHIYFYTHSVHIMKYIINV